MDAIKNALITAKIMRAVVVTKFGGPEVLQVRRDVPLPVPSASEVLVKVAAIGVNPVDTYIRSGNYSNLPSLPYIPGNDVAGTVVTIGNGVKDFKPGDKVASFMKVKSGGYAEFCVVHSDYLMHIPEKFDFRKGAAVGVPIFSAYKALFGKANAKSTDTVLVHGASGGVGVAACQLALSRGMDVIGTAGSEEGMKVVRAQGVKHVFNHKDEGYTAKIMKATDGRGVNVILEMLSNVNLNEDLKLMAPNGTTVVVGCRGPIEINPRLMMAKESKIVGMALFATTKEEFSEMNRTISCALKQGWLNPCIGAEYSLNNVQQAHRDLVSTHGAKGKMVLIV